MQISPIIISLKTASASIALTFLSGLYVARWIVRMKSDKAKMILDGILTLPLVLPPTVAGFLLLIVFGVNRPVGKFLLQFLGTKIVFSWSATVIAAAVISFPLMYRSARGAFEQVDQELIMAAIYSEVAAGNMQAASYYVIIVMLISFVVVVLTNYFSIRERKYFK